MVKLIRKYNKWLLVVLGSFLMVAFLFSSVPSFMQGDPRKQVQGTLAGTKVRAEQLGNAGRDFGFVSDFMPGLVENVGLEGATHWFLLAHEAKAQGLVGTPSDGEAWLDEVATAQIPSYAAEQKASELANNGSGLDIRTILNFINQNPQLRDQFAQQWLSDPKNKAAVDNLPAQLAANVRQNRTLLANRAGISVEEANATLATLRGVMRLVESADQSNRFSDKRFQYTLQRDQDAVLADVVSIPPTALTISQEPTLALLDELFAKGKDKEPSPTTGEFGYRQPNRVQLAWFTLSRSAVEAAIKLDSVKVRIEYERDRATYPGDFAAERPRIEQALRTKNLTDALATAEQAFRTRVRINTRALAGDNAIKTLTPEWRASAPALDEYAKAVVEAIATSDKVNIPAPTVQTRTTWARIDRTSELDGIGSASLTQAGRPLSFAQVIEQLHEFDAKSPLGLQVGVPFEAALRAPNGDLIFFVVTDAKLASPAETLAEVREDVVRDAKLVMAFEQLQAKASEWQTLAATSGLDEFVAKFNAGSLTAGTPPTTLSVQRQQRFAAGESTLAGGVGREPLRDAVLARANERGRLTAATEADRPQRTLVAALPVTRAVAIAQIVGDAPLTLEDFRSIPVQAGEVLARNERSRLMPASTQPTAQAGNRRPRGANPNSPFSFESLSKRLGWVPADGQKESKK